MKTANRTVGAAEMIGNVIFSYGSLRNTSMLQKHKTRMPLLNYNLINLIFFYDPCNSPFERRLQEMIPHLDQEMYREARLLHPLVKHHLHFVLLTRIQIQTKSVFKKKKKQLSLTKAPIKFHNLNENFYEGTMKQELLHSIKINSSSVPVSKCDNCQMFRADVTDSLSVTATHFNPTAL